MPRYAAFLRGVSPQNCKMSELKLCLENAGFTHVKTVLSSGNAVFDAEARSEAALEKKVEEALSKDLGQDFPTIVRSTRYLQEMIDADPYSEFRLKAGSKKVVTFLKKKPGPKISLPPEIDGARLLLVKGTEVFTSYVISPKGPVFMKLIEKTLGKEVTTRTWDTVQKVAKA